MRRVFKKKVAAALIFTITMFVGAYVQWKANGDELVCTIKQKRSKGASIKEMITTADRIITEKTVGKNLAIESYGYVQQLLGKHEENDFEVIKDQEGQLHLTNFANGKKDVVPLANEVKKLKERLERQGTKVIYAMTPDKVIKGKTEFATGLPYDYANETADALVESLQESGIDTVDFREWTEEAIKENGRLFYKTDHHWTVETAFFMYGKFVEELTKTYGLQVEKIEKYIEKENYNVVTYPNVFTGSLARKAGILYGGVDDFTAIYPKFETDYTFTTTILGKRFTTQGTFDQALINGEFLRSFQKPLDPLNDRYSSYLHGSQELTHIQNNKKKDGPKILIVKDSFMLPFAAFLLTICSEVYLVDPRTYEGDISAYAASIPELDYAFVSFSTKNLDEEFFRLNKQK